MKRATLVILITYLFLFPLFSTQDDFLEDNEITEEAEGLPQGPRCPACPVDTRCTVKMYPGRDPAVCMPGLGCPACPAREHCGRGEQGEGVCEPE